MIQGKIRPTQTSVSLPSIYSPERREAMTKLCVKALTGKKKKKRMAKDASKGRYEWRVRTGVQKKENL